MSANNQKQMVFSYDNTVPVANGQQPTISRHLGSL